MLTNAWLPGCILTAQESCNHNVDLGYDMVHRRFITQTVGYCKWISLIITNGHRLFQSVVGSGACHSSPHCWVICAECEPWWKPQADEQHNNRMTTEIELLLAFDKETWGSD